MIDWIMVGFLVSPLAALIAYCLWSLYRITQLWHPRPPAPRAAPSVPFVPIPQWQAIEEAYLEVRSMWCNLRYGGREWTQDRREVLVGISLNGFDVLGDEPVFTGLDGEFDEVAFYDDLYGIDDPKFCLARSKARHLWPKDRLVVSGSI